MNGNKQITISALSGMLGLVAAIGVPFIYINAIKTDVAVNQTKIKTNTENIIEIKNDIKFIRDTVAKIAAQQEVTKTDIVKKEIK